jgi:hypothetical protein
MAQHNVRLTRTILAFLLAVVACAAIPSMAAAADVTVRVEGRASTLLAPTRVTIGTGSGTARTWNGVGSLPNRCADDSAYQALELAVSGNWDRSVYAATILGETHNWSADDYWILYDNDNYADWGLCDLHLADGDTILLQAGKSGAAPDYIPDSVPIEVARVTPATGSIRPGTRLTVRLTAWRPTDIDGTPDPLIPGHWIVAPSPASHPAGYTVGVGGSTAVTATGGQAVITVPATRGTYAVQASVPGSSTNWSRSVPFDVCVSSTIC